MDDFAAALRAAERDAGGKGIGTLGEKSLHLALKYYFAPDPLTHERPLGGFVADAITEDGVIEVQTRGLSRLKPKLEAFLPFCPVTVVHPVIAVKQLVRVDENGAVQGARQSPKHETIFTAMREIYTLRDYVNHPNFSICLVSLALKEYSVQSGRRKRSKLDRTPTELFELWHLTEPADYAALLPRDLPQPLTAQEFGAAIGVSQPIARMMLNLYARMGICAADHARPRRWTIEFP